jgi:hypothetical protein
MPHQCRIHEVIPNANCTRKFTQILAAQFTDKGEIGSAGRGQIELIKGVMLEIIINGNLLKREDILEKRF